MHSSLVLTASENSSGVLTLIPELHRHTKTSPTQNYPIPPLLAPNLHRHTKKKDTPKIYISCSDWMFDTSLYITAGPPPPKKRFYAKKKVIFYILHLNI